VGVAALAALALFTPPNLAKLTVELPEAVRSAARLEDVVARELALADALRDRTAVPLPAALRPGRPGARLSPALRLLVAHAAAAGAGPRDVRRAVHALLHEEERGRERCAAPAGAPWAAVARADVLCGAVALAAMARRTKGEPEALRAALVAWDGLPRFCPGADDVLRKLHEWAPADRAGAVERRCRPPASKLRVTASTSAAALAFAYAAEGRLRQLGKLTPARAATLQALLD